MSLPTSRRRPRGRPSYPALLLAASLGAALVACGPGGPGPGPVEGQEQALAPQQGSASPPPVDSGTGPLPSDFLGGDMAYETLPDGGLVR